MNMVFIIQTTMYIHSHILVSCLAPFRVRPTIISLLAISWL